MVAEDIAIMRGIMFVLFFWKVGVVLGNTGPASSASVFGMKTFHVLALSKASSLDFFSEHISVIPR